MHGKKEPLRMRTGRHLFSRLREGLLSLGPEEEHSEEESTDKRRIPTRGP